MGSVRSREKPITMITDKWECDWYREQKRIVFYRRKGYLGMLVRGNAALQILASDCALYPLVQAQLVEAFRGLKS